MFTFKEIIDTWSIMAKWHACVKLHKYIYSIQSMHTQYSFAPIIVSQQYSVFFICMKEDCCSFYLTGLIKVHF